MPIIIWYEHLTEKCGAKGSMIIHFFARYLAAFDTVYVAIRIRQAENNEGYPNLCSGDGVVYLSLEEFKGPSEYLRKFQKIHK